ncbi:MAG: WYL domain-containing protein [Muribaculaceae bacterium]|nr:WYL domain-containing protein [Muribaculaceae bacterium]
MTKDLIVRYIWLVDLLRRHGRLTRAEISDLWSRDHEVGGVRLTERTFFNYRRAVEEIFHIDILCDEEGRYFIDSDAPGAARSLSNWLLDSYAVNQALATSEDLSDKVQVEDVPSAREWLARMIDAIRQRRFIGFTYSGFAKSRPEPGKRLAPYFLKRYKQRWYVIGSKEADSTLRTYALDRIRDMELLDDRFRRPKNLDMGELFDNIIGVTTVRSEVRRVRLKTTPMQAKYFRALPFHSSQREEIADSYSIFTYDLRVNYELVHELMGLGAAVEVLEPPELRVMLREALEESLRHYML